MTPATSQSPKNFWKQVGPAFRLLALFVLHAPVGWDGNAPVYVAGGITVTDAELAERTGVSKATISKWRSRLRKAGLITWLVDPCGGRVFRVAATTHIFKTPSELSAAEQNPAEDPATVKTEMVLTAPTLSRWVQ